MEQYILQASEARMLVKQAQEPLPNYSGYYNQIKQAAEKGKESINFSGLLSEALVYNLKENGYKVDFMEGFLVSETGERGPSNTQTTISWKL